MLGIRVTDSLMPDVSAKMRLYSGGFLGGAGEAPLFPIHGIYSEATDKISGGPRLGNTQTSELTRSLNVEISKHKGKRPHSI